MPSDRSGRWETTVTDLVLILQGAFRAIVPSLERARIPWREGEAYDDWDAIAEVLFEQVVLRSVRSALPQGDVKSLRFPRYGMLYPDYSEFSFIARRIESGQGPVDVFHSLATDAKPFDRVRFVRLERDGRPVRGDLLSSVLDGTRLRLMYRRTSGALKPLETLDVPV